MALLNTVLFVGAASWLTSWLGPVGMILGNVLNFGLRSMTSLWFVQSWCAREGLSMGGRLLLRPTLLGTLLAFGMLFYTTGQLLSRQHHMLSILALSPAVFVLVWRQERTHLLEVRSLLLGKKHHE